MLRLDSSCPHWPRWKTGTTTLQEQLFDASDLLRSYGITTGGVDDRTWNNASKPAWTHHKLAGEIISRCHSAACQRDANKCGPSVASLPRAFRQPTGHVIISSEQFDNMDGRTSSAWACRASLRHILSGFNKTRLVLTYRNPASHALSTYGQRLTVGKVGGKELMGGMQPYVQSHCANGAGGFVERVEAWAATFGPDNVKVLDFDGMVFEKEPFARALVHSAFPRVHWPASAELHRNSGKATSSFAPLRQLWGPVLTVQRCAGKAEGAKRPTEAARMAALERRARCAFGRGSLFATPPPAQLPTLCGQERWGEYKQHVLRSTQRAFALLWRSNISARFHSANATLAAIEAAALPCELDAAAARDRSWTPWLCAELAGLDTQQVARGAGSRCE